MTLNNTEKCGEFSAAAKYWQLERLYVDLAEMKGRGLTPLEKKFLQGLLCGYSPAEIAEQVYQNRSSSSVRVYLSNGLYKYIQELLTRQTGKLEKVHSWSRVTNLLEEAGYKKEANNTSTVSTLKVTKFVPPSDSQENWEERIDVTGFLGRQEELGLLGDWLIKDRCRVVTLLGMAGVGKTALAIKLVEQVRGDFDYIIWRSLRSAPPPEDFLADLIRCISGESKMETKISVLMNLLRDRRCLLVFDGFESVFRTQEEVGCYWQEYEGYSEMLQHFAQERHSSCFLIASREKPQEIATFEGKNSKVRSFFLNGLKPEEAQKLPPVEELIGSEAEKAIFVSLFANHPLALKLASLTIKNIFNRSITEFLGTKTILLSNIRRLLDQQFNRLSDKEKKVMYALAVNQKLMEWRGVGKELNFALSVPEQIEAIESLQRRSLLTKNSLNFAQESLTKAYILEKLVEQIETAINDPDLSPVVKHVLSEALLKDRKLEMKAAYK